MGFRNDFSKATQNNGLKPEGDYEVIIVKAQERTNKNDKTKLNFSFVIRNDVEQNYKNGYIFYELWKRKEPTAADMQVQGYSFGQIMALGKAAQLPDGKDYPDLNAFVQELINKPICVHLYHEKFKDKEREEISYIVPTKYPEVHHVMKTFASPSTYAAQPQTQYASQQYAQPQATYAAPAQQPSQYVQMPLDQDLPF
jgi:hypothetical protein